MSDESSKSATSIEVDDFGESGESSEFGEFGEFGERDEAKPFSKADFAEAYEALRSAARRLKQKFDLPTFNPTAVVHEAYLRLAGKKRFRAWSREHLTCAVVQAMHNLLVDAARRKAAIKRGGGPVPVRMVTIDDPAASVASAAIDPEQVLRISRAMRDLASIDIDAARAFKLAYFGGLTAEEIAELSGVTRRTIDRRLTKGRAFILKTLGLTPRDKAAGA